MTERDKLEQAIAALEAQRAILGDATVDAALAPMREKLAGLDADQVVEERKQVTILFADLAGFTAMSADMDPEEVHTIQKAYFSRSRKAIERHGGVVEKFIGDAVMAVFGVPTAYEDDPERAIRAALDMQAAMGELNQDLADDSMLYGDQAGLARSLRIGVNTGRVVISFMGGAEDFVAVGDTVNVTSRLESVAPPGGILISNACYRHVRGVFGVEPREPLFVKGKTDALQTYLVQRAKPRAFRVVTRGIEGIETRMVGRETELKHLQDALYTAIEDSERQIVTVAGEAGVGKSRLLYEFGD